MGAVESAEVGASTAPARGVPPSTVVDEYLAAFYSGDFDTARSMIAETFSFRGPFLQVDTRDAFFEGARGLRDIVRGHRILRQWEDGADVCSVYEVEIATPQGEGSLPMSEWHRIEGGSIVSSHLVFDSAAFRAIVPARGSR